MVEREQVLPLASASARDGRTSDDYIGSGNHTPAALPVKRLRRRKVIKCCGCITASVLLLAVIIVVLIFTVFKVKDPIIRMNGIKTTKLELINNNTTPKPGTNMSFVADVSVKNPNFVSFRYTNTTTTLYYHDSIVGEARSPPGLARARRTARMNVSMDIITDNLMSSSNFSKELGSGILSMRSYSRVPGQARILKIFKKHVVVKMNCFITFNVSGLAIQDLKCKRKVKL